MQNPRYLAFKALYKVETENAYSNLTLDSFLKNSDFKMLNLLNQKKIFMIGSYFLFQKIK